MTQPRLNVSINVSLDDNYESPSIVIHHYKPECHVQFFVVAIFKVKVTVTDFGLIQWSHDYFYYMFWTADFLATNLVWQCMFISWSVLWKGCFAVFKVKVIVKVLNLSECLPGQYLWSIKLRMVMQRHQPEYHTEISFCYVKVKVTIVSARYSEILKLFQPKLIWWYIITRQDKTPWKDLLAFIQGLRQRIWLGGLWTRLLPLLAIPISKAGVNTGSNHDNVERTLLL